MTWAESSCALRGRWLDRAAADFFAATLRVARRAAWLRSGARPPRRLYGLRVLVRRD